MEMAPVRTVRIQLRETRRPKGNFVSLRLMVSNSQLGAKANARLGVRRHVRASKSGDLSPHSKSRSRCSVRCPQRMNQGAARNPLRQRTLQRDLLLECGETSPLLEARTCLRTPSLALA